MSERGRAVDRYAAEQGRASPPSPPEPPARRQPEPPEPPDKGRYLLLGLLALVVLLLDQASKFWIASILPPHATIPVLSGFFDLVHIYNRGAAFGFLNRPDIEWQFWLFLGATIVSFGVIGWLAHTARQGQRLFVTGLGLILGGAVGNMIDRLRFRAVLDFLDFYVGAWHWPAFNVADIAISCGAVLVCFSLWRDREKA